MNSFPVPFHNNTHLLTFKGDVITNETTGETVVDDAIREISALNFADDHGFLKRIAWVESKFGADPNTFTNKNGQPYHGGIWQVDQIGFEDTKNVIAHPALRSKFQEIEDILKIRWSAVDWICLRSPLYSALAARLLLSNVKAPIPSSVESQASYWKKYYNKSGKGKKCKFITDVEELEKKEGQ